MEFIFTLFAEDGYLLLPGSWVGWAVLGLLFAVVAALLWRWRALRPAWSSAQWQLLAVLLVLTPVATFFFGLRPSFIEAVPPPSTPVEPVVSALMLLAALPWVLAALRLGLLPAALLGGLSGLLLGFWETHTLFTIPETMLVATLFGLAFHQPQQHKLYRWLQRPLVAALVLSLALPLLHLLGYLFLTSAPFLQRLDYALTQTGGRWLASAIPFLFAALLAEILVSSQPAFTPRLGQAKRSSQAGAGLQGRFLAAILPLAAVLLVVLTVVIWWVGQGASQRSYEAQMASLASQMAEESRGALELGQSLITALAADPVILAGSQEGQAQALARAGESLPFFDQLYLIGGDGQVLAAYPAEEAQALALFPQESLGVELAFQGITFQYYALPPHQGGTAAQLTFLAAVASDDQISAVLLGRSGSSAGPLWQSIGELLGSVSELGGEGMLVDGDGMVLLHSAVGQAGEDYLGSRETQPLLSIGLGSDGTRRLIYSQLVTGTDWSVVLTLPLYLTYQLPLAVLGPVVAAYLLLFLAVVIVGWRESKSLAGALHTLTAQAARMADLRLDAAIAPQRSDEAGWLALALEHMRIAIKARLEETRQLLSISQGLVSSTEMEAAVAPILEAALTTEASSVRLVLTPEAAPRQGDELPLNFGLGPHSQRHRALDLQVLDLLAHKDQVVLTNPARARLRAVEGEPLPRALVAVALKQGDEKLGALWLAYDQAHEFTEDEVRFLAVIANQAAQTVAGLGRFQSAWRGYQRLEAALAAAPEPILLVDGHERLLLANPAARELLGLGEKLHPGVSAADVLPGEVLASMRKTGDAPLSEEITFPDGRIFHLTLSKVALQDEGSGYLCLFFEITRYRELQDLMSEFVSTVSHELRSPLAQVQGYASMLKIVGDLNEQQGSYADKIVQGVEYLARLVINLLDLSRIESGADLRLASVLVSPLIHQVVDDLQIKADQKRVALTVEPLDSSLTIEADPDLLRQALYNLVDNAITFTEAEGEVNVRAAVQEDVLEIAVRDTGVGIAPLDQARLFERFFRPSRQEPDKPRRTRMGLAIVKSIVERHGGQVRVESQLGEGSTFTLRLPLRRSEGGSPPQR